MKDQVPQIAIEIVETFSKNHRSLSAREQQILEIQIIDAMEDQHQVFQQKCIAAIKDCEETGTPNASRIRRLEAIGACWAALDDIRPEKQTQSSPQSWQGKDGQNGPDCSPREYWKKSTN